MRSVKVNPPVGSPCNDPWYLVFYGVQRTIIQTIGDVASSLNDKISELEPGIRLGGLYIRIHEDGGAR